ncbi:MAG: DUF4920 domain-containing protein [Bacteroidota bacterium]|nr:DUF4920 domain-containing protein [Bacteroidota bacterium]
MKKIFLLVLVFISGYCFAQVKPAGRGSVYGSAIDSKGAISVAGLEKKLEDEKQFTGKVTGKVISVCQEKGCWMRLAKDDGDNIMIRFKDYGFFVPKNIDGKEVVLNGVAKKTTTSVAMLKHYAKDAGKSDEEIAKITEPKKEIVFTASGVLVL